MGLLARDLGWGYAELMQMEHGECRQWCRWLMAQMKRERDAEKQATEALMKKIGRTHAKR